MKKEELQIGDWVGNTYRELKGKVKSLFPRTYKEYDDIWIDVMAKTVTATFPIGNAVPIPLTEEMLELNGFKFIPLYGYTYFSYECLYLYHKYENRFYIEIGNKLRGYNIEINYVHELQHALRLCGLNELADNFKID